MSVTVNCHIDDDTTFTVDHLAGGTWTVDIGDDAERVTLFASRERLRAFAQQVLDGTPADDPDATEPAGIVL